MMKKTIAALAMLGAGVLGMTGISTSASAFTVPAPTSVHTSADRSLLVEVASRNDRRVERRADRNRVQRRVYYDRKRHGPRCTRYNNNCRYRYNGYYYASPWWLLPTVGATIVLGSGNRYGSRHVEWCYDHYRSYNARYNTWVSYSGDVRQCVSPYR